ncbi:MAG TPA: ATP-binding protein [Gemmatimonadaceae bacterium]|nr:ATP-binding protein [Gemmatimonadaceae bacterium]
MSLAQRLLLGAALVVSVLVLLLVALSGERLKRQLLEIQTAELTREARLVAGQWHPGVDADALAGAAGAALGHRVTLVDSTGLVIGDSEFRGESRSGLENHANRPEIIGAKRDSSACADRLSPSEGTNQVYCAARMAGGVARVSVPTQQLDDVIARARGNVLISGLAALVVALLLAYAFSRAVSQPVIELRDVTRALAAGDLSRRPALSAPGELGELAAAVHRLAEQLDSRLKALQADDVLMGALIESLHEGVLAVDSRRQIVRMNESGRRLFHLTDPTPFSADLLPRERALREALASALAGEPVEHAEITVDGLTLALTARPLAGGGAVLAVFDLTATRRLETVRRDFVANVSHELKTPLTVIGGFAETLVADDVPLEQRSQFAEAIRGNAYRMQQIVDDLLDLSRIESGGWVPNPATEDVRTVALEVINARQRDANTKQVALDIDIDSSARTIYADPTALRQVIGNLVDNALRYTNPRGSVTVFSAPDERGIWVGVRDTGIGIAAEHLPRIFERFYRADIGRSRDHGGTGLGLAIVRHLVEAHRGRVRAESAIGKGTTVAAFFPTAPAAASQERVPA